MITHITQSMINQLGRCPTQFEFRHEKNIIIQPGAAARKGSSVHKGAEAAHRFKVEHGVNPPNELVKDTTNDEFMRLVNDEGVMINKEDLMTMGRDRILGKARDQAIELAASYNTHYLPSVHKIALFEERLFADIGLGIPISGKPDLVADSLNNDIKTSGMRWLDGAEQHELQPLFYRVLLKENGFGALDSRFTVLVNMSKGPQNRTENTIWDKDNKVCIDVLDVKHTDEDEKKLVLRLQAYVEMINKGIFPPSRRGKGVWWCLSMDTEVLTSSGWKTYNDITDFDYVLTLNPYSILLEWQKPTIKFIKEHKERRMVSYDGRGLKFNVTPDHRFIVRSMGRGKYRWTTGAQIENKGSICFPVSGYLYKPHLNISDDILKLSGWLCAEGHFRKDSNMIEISQNYNTEGYRKIEELLKRLNYKYSINKTRHNRLFRILSADGRNVRKQVQESKDIPHWVEHLDAQQFRIWMNAFVDGDGHRSSDTSYVVSSKDESFIDRLQALAVMNRFSAVKGNLRYSSTGGKFWSLSLLDGITERITESAKKGLKYLKDVSEKEVWCLSVPNQTIMTRYKGRTLITGNCSPTWCGYYNMCKYT